MQSPFFKWAKQTTREKAWTMNTRKFWCVTFLRFYVYVFNSAFTMLFQWGPSNTIVILRLPSYFLQNAFDGKRHRDAMWCPQHRMPAYAHFQKNTMVYHVPSNTIVCHRMLFDQKAAWNMSIAEYVTWLKSHINYFSKMDGRWCSMTDFGFLSLLKDNIINADVLFFIPSDNSCKNPW